MGGIVSADLFQNDSGPFVEENMQCCSSHFGCLFPNHPSTRCDYPIQTYLQSSSLISQKVLEFSFRQSAFQVSVGASSTQTKLFQHRIALGKYWNPVCTSSNSLSRLYLKPLLSFLNRASFQSIPVSLGSKGDSFDFV